jgi:hypothetical protein
MSSTRTGGLAATPRLRRPIGAGWRAALLVALLAAPSAASAACGDRPPSKQPTGVLEDADDDLSPAELATVLALSATTLREIVFVMGTNWERTHDAKDESDFIPLAIDWTFSQSPVLTQFAVPAGCAAGPGAGRPTRVDSVFSYVRPSWRDAEVRDVQLEPLLSLADENRLHPPPPDADATPP